MSTRIAEQAAEWVQILESAPDEQREAFVDWVRAAPEHLNEFLLAMTLREELGRADWERIGELDALLEKAAPNVVSFPTREPVPRPAEPRAVTPRRHLRTRALSIAASVAVLACAVWWTVASTGKNYRTDIGEQRAVELSDGSVVNLNSRSQVQVKFTDFGRDVLLEGEALFRVEHDAKRPFRVHSGNAVIQAIGTQFNVHRLPSSTSVVVLEGVVQVSSGDAQVTLAANEEARIDSSGAVSKAQARELAGWHQHRLVFRDNTLEDIATEFNRWNRKQIRIETHDVPGKLYDGAFDAHDATSLIEFLARDPGLELERRADSFVIRPR